MKLVLQREKSSDKCTFGKIYADGQYMCDSLEDVVRDAKIYAQTAIPAGTYSVVLTKSPRFGRVLPLLENVPNYSGIRIHWGNKADQTEGCILPGDGRGDNYIYNSRAAFNRLFALLESSKTAITIEIRPA